MWLCAGVVVCRCGCVLVWLRASGCVPVWLCAVVVACWCGCVLVWHSRLPWARLRAGVALTPAVGPSHLTARKADCLGSVSLHSRPPLAGTPGVLVARRAPG